MKIKYANQPLEKSIFLAGPTPRTKNVLSWRPEALQLLRKHQFNGTVFVPESENNKDFSDWHYDNQVLWEWEGLNQATVILFWVPRNLKDMPAFTTNVEYGLTIHSSKVVLGFPEVAEKMKYLEALAKRFNIKTFNDLEKTIIASIEKTNNPFQ